jgi:DNA repair protein RecO (recombination protein O)
VPLVATPAVVLQAFPYSESSKILRLLTPELGVCSVIAKGAQRPRSRFGGLLEPFTEGEAQIYYREERELHTLGGFDLVRSRQALGQDLVAFAGASLIAELILRSATTEAQPRLFRLVSTALDRIVAAETGLLQEAVIADIWLVVALLGFRPHTGICVGCGDRVGPGEMARFDVAAGGVACARCRPHGRPVDPASLAELETMVQAQPVTAPFANPALQRALLRAFLTTHVAREFSLRSLDLFLQQLEA